MRAIGRLSVSLAFMCAAGSAFADGTQSAVPGVSLAPADWSGLYVGMQGGYGWSGTAWTFPLDSFFVGPNENQTFSTDPAGGIVGGHVTLNHQIGFLVIGAELAINGSFMKQERTGPLTPQYPEDWYKTELDNYGTLTGRLGFAHDNLLVYVNGGYAAGHVTLSARSGDPVPAVTGGIKQRLDGWTLGGGLEYMLATNVVFGLQYEFIRLDGETSESVTGGAEPGLPFVATSDDINLHAVTARLSIKLGRPDLPSPAVK